MQRKGWVSKEDGHVRRDQISFAEHFKIYSELNEKPKKSVKTSIDIIQLSFISITWSLIWKSDTGGRERIYEVIRVVYCGGVGH